MITAADTELSQPARRRTQARTGAPRHAAIRAPLSPGLMAVTRRTGCMVECERTRLPNLQARTPNGGMRQICHGIGFRPLNP